MKLNFVQKLLLVFYIITIIYQSFFNTPIKNTSYFSRLESGDAWIFKHSIFNPKADTFKLFIIILIISLITLSLLFLTNEISKIKVLIKQIQKKWNMLLWVIYFIVLIAMLIYAKYKNNGGHYTNTSNIDTTAVPADTASIFEPPFNMK